MKKTSQIIKVNPNLCIRDGKLTKITALEQIAEYSKFQRFTDKQIYELFFLGVKTWHYEKEKKKCIALLNKPKK